MTPLVFAGDAVAIPVDAHARAVLQIKLGFIAGFHFGAGGFACAGIGRRVYRGRGGGLIDVYGFAVLDG